MGLSSPHYAPGLNIAVTERGYGGPARASGARRSIKEMAVILNHWQALVSVASGSIILFNLHDSEIGFTIWGAG